MNQSEADKIIEELSFALKFVWDVLKTMYKHINSLVDDEVHKKCEETIRFWRELCTGRGTDVQIAKRKIEEYLHEKEKERTRHNAPYKSIEDLMYWLDREEG